MEFPKSMMNAFPGQNIPPYSRLEMLLEGIDRIKKRDVGVDSSKKIDHSKLVDVPP